jgi:glycogen operon protein
MLTTLLASLGTPMLVAGDEFGRTQQGNNNAYCQDNAISWLDWQAAASAEGQTQIDYVARLADLRRRFCVLRAPTFLYGQDTPGQGINDIEWWDERGQQLSADDWQNPEGRALMMRRASRNAAGELEVVSLLLNGSPDPVTFHLPPPHATRIVLIDSAKPDQGEVEIEDTYEVAPQGAVLLTWTGAFEDRA